MTVPVNNSSRVQGSLVTEPVFFEINDVAVCRLRIGVVNGSKVNCLNVIALGGQADISDELLAKGDEVVIEGALDRYERERRHGGGYEFHEYVSIVAQMIQIVNPREGQPEYIEGEPCERVSFDDLPSEVQVVIAERVAEFTEQGI